MNESRLSFTPVLLFRPICIIRPTTLQADTKERQESPIRRIFTLFVLIVGVILLFIAIFYTDDELPALGIALPKCVSCQYTLDISSFLAKFTISFLKFEVIVHVPYNNKVTVEHPCQLSTISGNDLSDSQNIYCNFYLSQLSQLCRANRPPGHGATTNIGRDNQIIL